MNSSKIIALSVGIIALVWILSGFLISSSDTATKNPEGQAPEKQLADVRFKTVTAQVYSDDLLVTGRSRASRTVDLKAEIDGTLVEILKEEGDTVTHSETIAKLELLDRQARAREAKERVNQRTIEYNAAKKLEGQGFNSKIRLAQSLADLEDAKAMLKQANIALEKTNILAPFDGVIFQQNVEIGDYMKVGDTMFNLVDLDPIEFVGFAPEKDIQNIIQSSTAKIILLNGQSLSGKVSYIAPAANEDTRTFRVIVSAENTDLKIKAGLTAKIYIPKPEQTAHKITPSILSLNDAGQVGVKIVDDQNKVVFKPIVILSDKTDGMWISGLDKTVRIITVGQEFVSEGQVVNPVQSQSESLL